MTDKFTIEDLMIKILPGGFLLAVIYFIFNNKIHLSITDNLDFFYTFIFFCTAFIVGELLQTIAHEIEWIINIFFKFRRPSEIFLYKNNPVLNNTHKRTELIEKLSLTNEEFKIFNKNYSELSILWWKNKKTDDEISQSLFWRLYSRVSSDDEIKASNRNYLFIRVIMFEFLLISIFLFSKNFIFGIFSLIICLTLLWRSRGMARGLVFKTILLNLK